MKLKVCGMKYTDNIKELEKLCPDFMGFIFYPKSIRNAQEELDANLLKNLDPRIQKVAVFVNESISSIKEIAAKYGIKVLQLHGNELPEFCTILKKEGFTIIKAFPVGETLPDVLDSYSNCCDYFLFDTKTENYGGSGKRFSWDILKDYKGKMPVFLSGGIGVGSIAEIQNLKDVNIFAVDINSCFEISPAVKNIGEIANFKRDLNTIRI